MTITPSHPMCYPNLGIYFGYFLVIYITIMITVGKLLLLHLTLFTYCYNYLV